MRKFSVKVKLTFWFTIFFTVVTTILILVILISSKSLNNLEIKNTLVNDVGDAINKLAYKNDELIVDDDIEDYDDVVILIYSKDKSLLYGRLPDKKFAAPFKNKDMQLVSENGKEWYIYDFFLKFENDFKVCIRGVMSASPVNLSRTSLILIIAICYPLLIISVAIGTYFISKRFFNPILKIKETAKHIVSGNDLTMRIGMKNDNDEFAEIAQTFDNMFERLQNSFLREKKFASDVSHEIRTPVAVMKGECEFALSQKKEDNELCKIYSDALKSIASESDRLSQLVTKLLMLSRAENGIEKPIFELINLSEIINIVTDEMEHTASEKNIVLHKYIDDNIIMKGDQTLLSSMIINLIMNAIKYGKEDGYINVHLEKSGETIVGSVVDNGIGIAENELPHVFERLYRADKSRSSSENNFGLGLPMVKWIVEIHGGNIYAVSMLGKGSTFEFTFPL